MTVACETAEPMARKSQDTSIRVDAEFAALLRRAAGIRGLSIGEYAKEVIQPLVERDLIAEAEKITKKMPKS